MMPDVWRVADDEIELFAGTLRSFRSGEVCRSHFQPGIRPKLFRGCGVERIDLVADGAANPIRSGRLQKRREKRTCAHRRIEEADFCSLVQKTDSVVHDLEREAGRRCELPQPIALW